MPKPGREAASRPPGSAADRPWRMTGALVLLGGLLLYHQVATVDKFRTAEIPPARSYTGLALYWKVLRGAVTFTFADYAVTAAIFLLFVGIVVAELHGRRFTRFLRWALASRPRRIAFLSVSFLVLLRFYFAPGEAWSADAAPHMAYVYIAARALGQWEFPIWTNYFGCGSPFLQFYGFTFACLSAAFTFLTADVNLGSKLVMALAHAFSGLAAYLFVSRLMKSRAAGTVAAFAYVLCMWHTQQVLVMGRLPLSLFYAALPLPFYFLERLRRPAFDPTACLGGAAALAFLVFTHPGYGFWATLFVAVYASARVLPQPAIRRRSTLLFRSALLLVLGLVLSACLTVPMWHERAYTDLYRGLQMSSVPDPSWAQLVTWSNYTVTVLDLPPDQQHWYGGYLGLSLMLIALGNALAFGSRRPNGRALLHVPVLVCLALSLLVVFGYRWPVLRDLSFVQAFNAGRYLLFVTFFLAAAAGCGTRALMRRTRFRGSLIGVPAACLLLVLADLGPTTFRFPYIGENTGWDIPTGVYKTLKGRSDQLADGRIPEARTCHLTNHVYYLMINSWLAAKVGLPVPFGVYNENPTACAAFAKPVLSLVQDGYIEGSGTWNATRATMSGLTLLNVDNLIVLHRLQTGGLTTRIWRTPLHQPIIVSPALDTLSYPLPSRTGTVPPEQISGLLAGMGVDLVTLKAQRIYVLPPAEPLDLGTQPEVEVLSHDVWNQRAEIRCRVSEPCIARLSYAYYPYLRVTVDGRVVKPYQTSGRFIALRLEAGEHRIALTPYLSPLRRRLFAVDAFLLAAGMIYCIRDRRKPRLRKPEDEPHIRTH